MSRPLRSAADVAAIARRWYAVPVVAVLALMILVLGLHRDRDHGPAPAATQQVAPENAASEPAPSSFVGA